MYSVKENFYTLQGEGAHTGRPAVFCRFSGCNLWSGLEKHRNTATCTFCDTDFRGTNNPGGGKFNTAEKLAKHIASFWPVIPSEASVADTRPFVVCTGGEPLLQLDQKLVNAIHNEGFEIAIETNGTQQAPEGIDWITVSPKGKAEVILTECDELKLVYPQQEAMPERFSHIKARYYYLTPMADPHADNNTLFYRDSLTQQTIEYCLKYPKWRLNLQSHKVINIA